MDMLAQYYSTIVAMGLALVLGAPLILRVSPSSFQGITFKAMGISAGLFWGVLASVMIFLFWQTYYSYFAPPWYRVVTPFGAVLFYALVGMGMQWIARRLPGNPVLIFLLLGGLESLPEHAVGIYVFNILSVPILEGSRAHSIFLFAFFEYVLYWGAVLLIALAINKLIVQNKLA